MDTVTTAEHLFTDRVLPAILHKMRRIPLKIGVRINPPSIVYIYKESGNLRMRSMPLRNLWPNSDVDFVIEDFRNRHREHIEDIPDFALRKMINIVKLAKQGRTIEEALRDMNSMQRKKSKETEDDSVFNRLKSNIRSSSGDFTKPSTKATQNIDVEEEQINGVFKKKEFPKKISFGTNLFDEIRIAESKMAPTKKPSLNRANSFDIPERDTGNMNRPSSLEVNNFELSTAFNSYRPQEKAVRQSKSNFLLDLEKEMDEIENSKKDESSGKLGGKENQNQAKQSADGKQQKATKLKNEDDTDVEFDDSDNPLDHPEDDFW